MLRATATQCETEIVGLLLAGLTNAAAAAASLGVGTRDLGALLRGLGLADAAAIPVEVDDELTTSFADLGRSAFDAPLFDDVVDGAPKDVLRFHLSADTVLAAAAAPSACPAGLVLHVGRCGSTLLCNHLTSVGSWVALKEPEFVNSLLVRLAEQPDPETGERVGELVGLLIRSLANGAQLDADGRERRCVVKLTSWNAIFAGHFVGRLGSIPLVVLTRDPWATVGSFLERPPHWYGSRLARGAPAEAASLFAEGWNRIVDRALRLPEEQTLFVSYAELMKDPQAVLNRVVRHLGGDRVDPGAERVRDVTARYSKGASGERFEPIGRHRRAPLAEDVRELVTSITGQSWSLLAERTATDSRRLEPPAAGRASGPIRMGHGPRS